MRTAFFPLKSAVFCPISLVMAADNTAPGASVTQDRESRRGRVLRLDSQRRRAQLKRLVREGRYQPEPSEIARAILRYLKLDSDSENTADSIPHSEDEY